MKQNQGSKLRLISLLVPIYDYSKLEVISECCNISLELDGKGKICQSVINPLILHSMYSAGPYPDIIKSDEMVSHNPNLLLNSDSDHSGREFGSVLVGRLPIEAKIIWNLGGVVHFNFKIKKQWFELHSQSVVLTKFEADIHCVLHKRTASSEQIFPVEIHVCLSIDSIEN